MLASFVCLPAISFSTLDRRKAVVEKITLTNDSSSALVGLEVRLTASPKFAEDWHLSVPRLEAGASQNVESPDLLLDAKFLGSVSEEISATLRLEVREDDTLVAEDSFDLAILPTGAVDDEERSGSLLLGLDETNISKLTVWERKLLDLSLRNNLLNTRFSRGSLQLISVAVNALEDSLSNGLSFTVCPKPEGWNAARVEEGFALPPDASDPMREFVRKEQAAQRLRCYLTEEELKKSLTKLYGAARLSIEENGVNTLYLTIGMLRWFDDKHPGKPHHAPILLLPVELVRTPISSGQGFLLRSRDEEIMLNVTLVELLRQLYDIDLSPLTTLPKDEHGVDVPLILETVTKAVARQTDWAVQDMATLGIFSFGKFILWNDIRNNSDKLAHSPIVAALIDGVARLDGEGDLDECVTDNPDELFAKEGILLPISADSSQMAAIAETLRGNNFILHGPPGTGKSQTITNIIANALYAGKRVLFVAEKMAALQVVQHRLESIGLAPFCLELHSNKAKKSSVLDQLKRSIETPRQLPDESYSAIAQRLHAKRQEVGTFLLTMHRRYPAGLSRYDCLSKYLQIDESVPVCDLGIANVSDHTPDSIVSTEGAVKEYQALAMACCRDGAFPLDGIYLTEFAPGLKVQALHAIEEVRNPLSLLDGKVEPILAAIGFDADPAPSFAQLLALRELLSTLQSASEILPSMLAGEISGPAIFDQLGDAVERGKAKDRLAEEILRRFDARMLEADEESWKCRWQESGEKWLVKRQLMQNKIVAEMQALARPGVKLTRDDVIPAIQSLAEYRALREEVGRAGESFRSILGDLWDAGSAAWDRLAASATTCKSLYQFLEDYAASSAQLAELRHRLAFSIGDGLPAFRASHAAVMDDYCQAFDALIPKIEEVETMLLADLKGIPDAHWTDAAEKTLSRWTASLDDLHDWTVFNLNKGSLLKTDAKPLVEKVENGELEPSQILLCYRKSLYAAYADFIQSKEPVITGFHRVSMEDKIKQYHELCTQYESLTRSEIVAVLSSRFPDLQKEAAQNPEVAILQRNIRNNGRGTSIRRLFDQIPKLLPRLCPCMLMSPLSVAQYIDLDEPKFDLVIFDEASQMPTCEAVGAIARGKQLIVVGDPNQMPPTDFFATNNFDEENADLEDLESILDDCLALSIPSRHLKWHYRSKHESLIAFSNMKYYDSRLLTFPSPDDMDSKVSFQHVEGCYDRGVSRQNLQEAKAVVDEILRRLSDPILSQRTLGVVTFNTNQQSVIESLLNEMLAQHPELESLALGGEEPIFVKNLENVQGDERDVILFSVGFGPDKEGKITLNFGPLNRDGGWRRLNVAVSRARYEMKVFSTLRADDIDLSKTKSDGVAGLKAFLEYAEKGRNSLMYALSHGSESEDGFVEMLASQLRRQGYEVQTNVGTSEYRVDIGVVDPTAPNRYLIGIICDGYNYSRSHSLRDRLITQPSVMKMLGWRLCRVWSLDWLENPARCLAYIEEKIKESVSAR